MRPRRREQQKQSSRMYLRRKNHRDCIMNNKYHNAIWLNKEQDGVQKDELAWVKYPKNAVLNSNGGKMGWLDLDRQFNYQHPSNPKGKLIGLDDFAVNVYTSSTSLIVQITKDGMVWNTLTIANASGTYYRFGRNGIAKYVQSGNNITVYWIKLEFEEDEPRYQQGQQTYYLEAVSGIYRFVCESENGFILQIHTGYVNNKWHMKLYEFNDTSSQGLFEFDWNANFGVMSGAYNGHLYVMAFTANQQKMSAYSTKDNLYIATSTDLSSWNTNPYGSYTSERNEALMKVFVRDRWIYFFMRWGSNYQQYFAYKTLYSEELERMDLPVYLDVPILKDCGACSSNITTETVQVRISNGTYPSADKVVDIRNYFLETQSTNDLVNQWGNVGFADGEPNKYFEGLTIYSGGLTIYLEDVDFYQTDRSFAYNTVSFNSSSDYADVVRDGDYVLGNTSTESEE